MTLTRNAFSSVPDGPPLLTMARFGTVLHVTVLHAAAADLLWQNRQGLTEIHECLSLRLCVLNPAQADGSATEVEWQRPKLARRLISARRR